MIQPTLLYDSEIWGYENLQIMEIIHLSFYKSILKDEASLWFMENWGVFF